jgi:ornithine cyclodeaminase
VVLVDPETGEPIAIIAGKTLTTLRTGAAGGVAARVLAREDARTLAVVGTGVQGEIQVEAALVARPGVEEIRYCSPVAPVPERFKERFSGRARLVPCGSPAEAARGAHIVITGTPSAEPLLDLADVDPGTHVTAVGADAKGKREIGPGLLAAASRFVDSAEQARSIGEHQHAPELAVTEIGTLIEAGGSYRRRPDEITLFDSTGVAFQDLAAARRVYDLAVARGAGRRVPWPT